MAEKNVTPDADKDTPTAALLFELENIGFQGRQVVFDVFKSVLADKDMQLKPVHFSRCCVDASIEAAVPQLLEILNHPRMSAEKLVPDIVQGIRSSLSDNTPKSPAALATLLEKARAKGYQIGVVSDLDAEAAALLYGKLNIGDPADGAVVSAESEMGTGDSLAWKTAARALGAPIPSTVVLATSNRSARAAVAAGMRCLAIPDAYTSFQDFGGADRILDGLTDSTAEEILSIMAEYP